MLRVLELHLRYLVTAPPGCTHRRAAAHRPNRLALAWRPHGDGAFPALTQAVSRTLRLDTLPCMNRRQSLVFLVAAVSLGLLGATPARAQSLTEVARATWAGSVSLPSYVKMYIYVPTKLADKPPIVVSAHACGSTAEGQWGNIPKTKAAATANGFILILPDNPNQNCWDVGNPTSLKHDGGGDTQAVATMVKYALTKYNGDPSRVYIFGGSSGGMMTQAMLAVYPDVFKAGHARAGVPAGCWADGYDFAKQWSNTCSGGNVSKTGVQWGDLVRSYFPGYSGHRPRVQLVQGGADSTISSKNMAESIKEWTNVLGLSETSTSKDTGYKGQASTYDRQFWKNACGFTVLESWVAPGQGHSMAYEEDALLKFFGLDEAGGADPEDAACAGDGGVGGSGGGGRDGGMEATAGTGGTQATGGSGTGGAGGTGGRTTGIGGSSSAPGGTGGSSANSASAGGSSNGGAIASGGRAGIGGSTPKGGSSANDSTVGGSGAGAVASSFMSSSGGASSGGAQASAGSSSASASSGSTASTTSKGSASSGCSYAVVGNAERSAFPLMALLSVALVLSFRRPRPRR
jgi:acetylxylan esterase